MNRTVERRDFLKYAAVAAGTAVLGSSARGEEQAKGARLLKALQSNMLPKDLLDAQKLALARKCGFEGIELNRPLEDLTAAKELGAQARQAGVPIHSVVNGWGGPLSDPKPENVAKGLADMELSLRCAKAAGADAVLLVPAVVNDEVGYAEAWERSQKNIRKLLPLAKELQVTIAVENVWNKFLLSPLEFARYVDEFNDPWLRAYIDVGNMILFGFAQDWIRTVGKRIVRIHLKDFKRQGFQWTNLLDGDVNWPQVRKALDEIGYRGYLTPELSGGDEAYLTDLSKRVDKIIAMKA
ncbi:MAG: TIM barrel protein [Sedimentisphaerales bacterium]|jgi:hexulose-6-phosphate isomerase|nr:TIM barrel protein [Sedimentisphaerales bacterium]NLZ07847.1 TIM barrel protein [Phycisphaerae bacterium]HOI36230.1 TIM barrel protein [Bacillota bacterium]HQA91634.1 TIM barrel protein [Sedimentisphaerales bacterium]